jgi:hypothetical protein
MTLHSVKTPIQPVANAAEILNKKVFQQIKELPYDSKISFLPLINYWTKKQNSSNPAQALLAREIISQLKSAPALLQAFESLSILEKHQDLAELLYLTLFPVAQEQTCMGRIFKPLDGQTIYTTPAFAQLILAYPDYECTMNRSEEETFAYIVYIAGCLILNKYYGQNLKVELPLTVSIRLKDSGLEKHYKCTHNSDFMDVVNLKPLPQLTDTDINALLSDPCNTAQWLSYFPSDHFEFQGFIVEEMTEITEELTLSKLKYQLLEKDALVSKESINQIEDLLRTLLDHPNLRLGIAAVNGDTMRAAWKYKIHHNFLKEQPQNILKVKNSVYQQILETREFVLIEDLAEMEEVTKVELALLDEGLRSYLALPLEDKTGKLVGFLEVASAKAFELNRITALKVDDLKNLFSLAIQRRKEETDNKIEAIIRDQYTRIHPSVEWRFVNNAHQVLLNQEAQQANITQEAIRFKQVYPFFAQADIVSSSTIRNSAIQADLIDNLRKIKRAFYRCNELLAFPILEQYIYKLDDLIIKLKQGISSNTESRVLEFLHQEAHPILEEIKERHEETIPIIERYYNYLDPELKMVYKKRKDYEESVTIINDTLGKYLDKEDREAQKMVPHYFDQYRTDGVEFEMYAGQSLLEKAQFSQMQLSNLRLWQLLTMCTITQKVADLEAKLPVPLTTAQMIFVYNNPIDIRFRMDEKRFDVDGAYNVRYEIIKKRIDKALIAGTNERIRAAGKIAIIYTNEKDREEYMEYIRFLSAKGIIQSDVEQLNVGKLQGVEGLKALRVTVNVKNI